jgi:hypothetical protein
MMFELELPSQGRTLLLLEVEEEEEEASKTALRASSEDADGDHAKRLPMPPAITGANNI